MARHPARIGTLSIPNGGTDSPALSTLSKSGYGAAIGLLIGGPAALTGTVTVQVQNAGDATWRTLQSGGADVAIAATKAIVISPTVFADLRLHSSGAEGAQRDFVIDSQIDATGYNL